MNTIVYELRPRKGNPRNSEGDFIKLKNGDILFIYTQFVEGCLDNSKAQLASLISKDEGESWIDNGVVIENMGQQNTMSVSLLRLHSGEIAMFFLVKNGFHDSRVYMSLSKDEAIKWSYPCLVIHAPGYFVLNNDRVIQLQSGRILVPVSYHRHKLENKTSWESFDNRGILLFYFSDDKGTSWNESKHWLSLPFPESNTGFQEPGIIEIGENKILAWCRTDLSVQFKSLSDDGGDTWTQPEPWTDFSSPCSPLSIKKDDNDTYIALWNDHFSHWGLPKPEKESWGRTPLVVAISNDNAKTWVHHSLIEDDSSSCFCYSAIHIIDNDKLLFAYCAGGKNSQFALDTLRIRKVSLKWIKSEDD